MNGFLFQSPPSDVFEQMAMDEAMAHQASDDVFLRFYRWTSPAVTFGYGQKWAHVSQSIAAYPQRPATRRPTGGGIVIHESDITFSAVFPVGDSWRPAAVYERVHTALRCELESRCGLQSTPHSSAAVAPLSDGTRALDCFARPVAMDLMHNGQKILGGAMRRIGRRILYQGSLQLPEGRGGDATTVEAAMTAAFSTLWKIPAWTSQPIPPPDTEILRRYQSAAWIQKR